MLVILLYYLAVSLWFLNAGNFLRQNMNLKNKTLSHYLVILTTIFCIYHLLELPLIHKQ